MVLLRAVSGITLDKMDVFGSNHGPLPLSGAQRYARFAMASYCDDDEVWEWNCHYCDDPSVRSFRAEFILYDPLSFTSAFVGVQDNTKEIIVAFRGTVSTSVDNWASDLDSYKIRLSFIDEGIDYTPGFQFPSLFVHEGFLLDFLRHIKSLREAVVELQQRHPDYTISITGHSLGGAMATLGCLLFKAGSEYQSEGLRCITFGSPRVGDQAFASYFDTVIRESWRYTRDRDPIVHLPPQAWGFVHVNTEVYSIDGVTGPCYAASGMESEQCANARLGTYPPDHLTYLGISRHLSCKVSKIEQDNLFATQ